MVLCFDFYYDPNSEEMTIKTVQKFIMKLLKSDNAASILAYQKAKGFY